MAERFHDGKSVSLYEISKKKKKKRGGGVLILLPYDLFWICMQLYNYLCFVAVQPSKGEQMITVLDVMAVGYLTGHTGVF